MNLLSQVQKHFTLNVINVLKKVNLNDGKPSMMTNMIYHICCLPF
jgi:hypothetical protein